MYSWKSEVVQPQHISTKECPITKKKAFKLVITNKSSTEFPILLIANNPNFYEQIYES